MTNLTPNQQTIINLLVKEFSITNEVNTTTSTSLINTQSILNKIAFDAQIKAEQDLIYKTTRKLLREQVKIDIALLNKELAPLNLMAI